MGTEKMFNKSNAVHKLKTLPYYFQKAHNGQKTFEIRKDDRNFKVGDELLLEEFVPDDYYYEGEKEYYTGNFLHRRITFILKDVPEYGLMPGFVILGLVKI